MIRTRPRCRVVLFHNGGAPEQCGHDGTQGLFAGNYVVAFPICGQHRTLALQRGVYLAVRTPEWGDELEWRWFGKNQLSEKGAG